MNVFGVNRYRILLVIIFLLICWQIMKHWNEYTLNNNEVNLRYTTDTPVVVGVYYEALCPDSKHFVIKQLQTTYNKAPYLINIELIPYGKASTSTNSDGSLSFQCQHGSVECDANIIHACTIETITDPELRLNAIACMIKDNIKPLDALKTCLENQPSEHTEKIIKCFGSPHGAELLKVYGEETDALRPKMSFVPTVTLDGMQNYQGAILKDLFSEVCKVATGRGPPPPICEK